MHRFVIAFASTAFATAALFVMPLLAPVLYAAALIPLFPDAVSALAELIRREASTPADLPALLASAFPAPLTGSPQRTAFA